MSRVGIRFLAIAVWAIFHACVSAQTPSFSDYRQTYTPSDAVLLDRHGVPIASKRIDFRTRRLSWVGLDDVSPAFVQMLLTAEDKRFFSHSGVDWLAVSGAIWSNLGGNKTRGASSISMQVVASIQADLKRPKAGRGVSQKWKQMQAASALERTWSKQQILETYFNTVSFRGELQGIHAGARAFFDKAPSGLNRAESAVLASLIRSPNAKPDVVAARACTLLDKAECHKDLFVQWLLTNHIKPLVSEQLAPHAAARLLDGKSERVTTSLDSNTQRAARAALRDQLSSIQLGNVKDGAVVVLDNKTGAVLAYVGSSGALSDAALVDAASSPRQAGSTLKPFLYALALERNLLTPATLLDDTPISLPTAAGLYTPQNYDLQFVGPVSVRKALASSLNIPAVQTILLTGVAPFHHELGKLGFKELHADPEHYGYALALGAVDLTLLDLTNAYRTLANKGLASRIRWTSSEPNPTPERLWGESTAWQISNILSDNRARSHTFGFDSVLATPMWSAAKTGTSKDMRDNWCVGYSEHFTIGVWVGNASGAPMHDVSGVSGAAPIWAEVMGYLHQRLGSKPPAMPRNLYARTVQFESDLEPTRTEWFERKGQEALTSSEPLVVALKRENLQASKITYPLNGSLLARDPDIPKANQGIVPKHSVQLAESAGQQKLRWVHNGVNVPTGLPLSLIKGKNELTLIDREDRVLDRVQFEVR